jgi:CRISPR system Cascade subunit CasB
MEARSHDERLVAFRRMAALAGGSLPVRDLAGALLDWSDRRRSRWIYDYWNAGRPAAPETQTTPAEDTTA